jgi:hypothetical protein
LVRHLILPPNNDSTNIKKYLQIIYMKYCFDKYYIREECCMCKSGELELLLENDLESQLSLNLYDYKNKNPFIPYNILSCKKCNTAQNKYLGNLELVYEKNHQDSFSKTKTDKHNLFKSFILDNKNIYSIIEAGASNGILADNIINESKITYTIIEPNVDKKLDNRINAIDDYLENIDISKINSNCLVMSDMFEHFYEPLKILEKIKNSNIDYIILNHPNFDHAVKNKHCIILNIEHTFLIENNFLFKLMNNYGFKLNRKVEYLNFSLFLEFKKVNNNDTLKLFNVNTKKDLVNYINEMKNISTYINNYMENNSKQDFYIWPCSVHSCTLFLFGLNYKKLKGILDNSPNKIGKFIDGYNLYCNSFNELLNTKNENITVFISGANAYIDELKLNNNINIIKINKLLIK